MIWSKLLTPVVVPMVLSAMVAFGGPGGVLEQDGGPAPEVRRESAAGAAGSAARGLMFRAATSVTMPGGPYAAVPDGTAFEPGADSGDAPAGAPVNAGETPASPSSGSAPGAPAQ